MDSICFFLPTRKGSERVINKNTRTFSGIEGGILKLKIDELLKVKSVNKIIISTNDSETIEMAKSFKTDRIVIIERPDELCLSSTIIEDFINYIPSIVNEEHIFWVHTTAPFVTAQDYEEALCKYWEVLKSNVYDSLISVTKIQQFIWDAETKQCVNHDRSVVKWPRTQDLKPLYEINHAFYINSRKNYINNSDRIGITPYLYELDRVKSFDIDWEDDFVIAEALYERFRKQ
jgi:CMP-N-acetylneuraminic acid synthetase